MFQSIYYNRSTKTCHLRDDKQGWVEFEYYPTFYKVDPNGKYQTLDGRRANPTKKYDANDNDLLEKDIPIETNILVDCFKDYDDAPQWHNIVFLDIECEIAGALTPENIKRAGTKITSIALYDKQTKVYYCFVLDESKSLQSIETDDKKIISCFTEKELLHAFLNKWEEIDPTIISGWNSEYFDMPFLYYRIENQLGKDQANRLSPLKIVHTGEYFDKKKQQTTPTLNIRGINHLDYMLLHQKFIMKQEPSYKLNDIGLKYVKLGKVEYEGSLSKLFKEDINKFIEYNIRDVEILVALDDKLQFIDLTVNICHLCHTPYENIFYSTALNEGAILTYLRRKDIVSPNKPTTLHPELKEMEEEYAGGYLKDPIPGLYEWVIDLDFTSLYPSIIRSLNIGVETLVGNVLLRDKYDNKWALGDIEQLNEDKQIIIENKKRQQTKILAGNLKNLINKNKFKVSAAGGLFKTDIGSVSAEVLTDWFAKRKEYKNLMKKAGKANDKELYSFYDKRQHAYKIKLNDLYGCYAVNSWRYTDGYKVISKSITLTGQRLTQESIKFVNNWINKKLNTEDKDYIVTSDTDSLFIQVKDLCLSKYPELQNQGRDEWVKAVLEIASEIQKAANENLNKLVKELFNIHDEHYFELKQEVVLERGYFAGKRRYAMFIVNKEGVPVEELVVMGMDVMKSNFPPVFRKFGSELIQNIMFGKSKKEIDKMIQDFKKSMNNRPILELAKPTGVKEINKYINRGPTGGAIFSIINKGAPVNTKAAIYYNDLLRFKKLDKKYSIIQEYDKIYWVYLKDNPYKIDNLALTGNDPEEITSFINEYVDKEKTFDTILLNKLENLYADLNWSFPSLNAFASKFFSFK
jgi:DNA polymerase elongation subunit (family B)